MEIRIGVRDSSRELSIETKLSQEEVTKLVSESIKSGSAVLSFSNEKGGSVLIPTTSLGYIEFAKSEERRVGFIA